MVAPAKLTNLQVELMQTFSYSLPEEQLIEIRQLLARYFLDKADAEMDKLWQENGWGKKISLKLGPKGIIGRLTGLSRE